MNSFGQFKICVQKELPDTQNQLNSIRMESRSLNEYQKLKAAFYNDKEWPVGSTINIYIGTPPSNIEIVKYPSRPIYDYNGNLIKLDPLQTVINSTSFTYTNIRDMIKRIINERFKSIVNLNFVFVSNINNSDIRIAFDLNSGSWSYIGTDCKYIQKTQPTMNFGWFEVSVVLHEFGHAVGGMIHEHQSPLGDPINWNVQEVYNWAQSTQGWNQQQTDSQILNKYDKTEINGSNFDPKSVMLYFYPAYLTLDNKGTSLNTRLSPQDTIYLNLKYPGSLQTPQQFYINIYGENILTESSTTATLIPSTNSTFTTTEIPSATTKTPSTNYTTEIPETTSVSVEIPLIAIEIPKTTTEIPQTTSVSVEIPLIAIEIPETTSVSVEIPFTTTEVPLTTISIPTPVKNFNKLYVIALVISIPIIALFLLLILL